MRSPLYAVIPTIGERMETLVPMVDQLSLEGVNVILIDNGAVDVDLFLIDPMTFVFRLDWDGQPVNLSHLWNAGLDWAQELADGEEHTVAILNDDLVLPNTGMIAQFHDAIEEHDAAAAFAAPFFAVPEKLDADSPLHLGNRMSGYAFALRGSKGLRADERLLWWWGDTDLDIQARVAGGVVGIPVPGLGHLDPNGYTNRRPELAEQAGRDRETFRLKHGYLPW